MKLTQRNQRGAAILLVLIAVAVATILALSFLATQGPTNVVAKNIDRKAQARQIAESALEMAIDYVNEDATWRTDKSSGQWMTSAALNGGTFDLFGTDEADGDLSDDSTEPVQLVVVATYNGVTHRVSAIVTPGGTSTPASRIAFVVGNDSSLTAGETARRTLIEGWGFTVTLVDDGASQGDYDTAAASADCFFVSSDAASWRISTKLRDQAIGVVYELGQLSYYLQIAYSGTMPSGTTVDVVDTSHYITQTFSTGILTYANSSTVGHAVYNTVVSGAQTLIEQVSSSNRALVVVDSGGQLLGGYTAAGRRVKLPWARSNADLSTDGLTILRRSLEWGSGGTSSSGRLLFVVGNGSSPGTQDQERRDLFASWGYTVTYIDDSASESSFDTAVAVNDVIYISETVNSSSVAYGFTDATIGVVNEEPYLHDEFGFTTNNTSNSTSNTAFDIADNSHTITAGFSTGSLTFADSSVGLRYVTSTPASGVDTLVDRSGSSTDPVLMVADSGATLYGGTAAGRRVMWSLSGGFDVDRLNSNGQTMLQRSLQWAEGSGSSGPTLIALYEFEEQSVPSPTLIGHWKLDESASPGFGGISAGEEVELKDNATINSYNSNDGAYGSTGPYDQAVVTLNSTSSDKFKMESSNTINGDAYIGVGGSIGSVFDLSGGATITGSQLVQTENISITTLSAPTGMPSSSGNFDADSYDDVTINSDRTYGTFVMDDHATVRISGDVTVWVTGDVDIKGNSQLIIPSGSSLTLYTGDDLDIEEYAQVNNDSAAANRLTIYGYGYKHVDMKDAARMAAIVYTNDDFHVKDSIHFYGKVLAGQEVKIEGNAQVHHDLALGGFETGGGSGASGPSVQLDDRLTMRNSAIIDGYDASAGDYGSSNRYLATAVLTDGTSDDEVYLDNADIYGDVYVGDGADLDDSITLRNGSTISGAQAVSSSHLEIDNPDTPTGFGSSSGNTTYDNNTTTWSSDLHVNNLTLRNNAQVNVSGNVQVRVSGTLTVDNSDINLNAGATLTIWLGNNLTMRNGATINDESSRAGDVAVTQYGDNRDALIDNATLGGSLHVSDDLTMRNNAQLYGTLTVEDDITLDNADVHINVGSSGSGSGSGGAITTTADESSTANSGTPNGSMAGGASGVIDTAYGFDGSDDYVEIPHHANYLLDVGSVGLHFYPTAIGGLQGLFSKDSSGYDNGGHLTIYTDGSRLKARIQTDGNDPYGTGDSIEIQSSSGVLSNDTWYHALVTWGDGQFRLYLNGTLVASANHLGGLGTTSGGSGNNEPIVIGANASSSGDQSATPVSDYFTGRIDDVRIYDQPLDASQASNLAVGSEPGSRAAPGYIALDTSGYDNAANLIINDPTVISWVSGGGLTITGDTLATTLGSATKIHDAIEANGAFAVEMTLDWSTQAGNPSGTQILGYATAQSTNNFAFVQQGTNYGARVRDSSTGNSGALSPDYFESMSGYQGAGDRHVVLTYQDGTVSVYLDGQLHSSASAGGTLDNWDAGYPLVFGGSFDETMYWNGTIKRIAIYDEGFNASQASNVYNGLEPGSGETEEGTGPGSVDWEEVD